MEAYYHRRTAKWIGKILRMEPARDPKKLITSWANSVRNVGRPIMNLGHTYMKVVRKCELGNTYEHIRDKAQNKQEWDSHIDRILRFPRTR